MNVLSPTVRFDPALLRKYDQPLPRYTSYPPATELSEAFQEVDFRAAIAVGNRKKTPLSLYCHIPFCERPCYFCGCNTVITQRKQVAEPYLDYLSHNIKQVGELITGDGQRPVGDHRRVQQMHWGGGTPNYLSPAQLEILWNDLHQQFLFDDQAELSIEVNPAFLDRDYVFFLKHLGFNRISFGIQDFNPTVQVAVNRIQPETLLFRVMDWMRAAGFESVNVDLIYGLPFQTPETFRETVQKTIALNPDRIAVFNFAYVPWLKPIQKRMPQNALPSAVEKLKILQLTIEELTQTGGYQFIGMDHFAKPDDELAIAQCDGQLHRNFQGYTTQPESDLFGFGMTAISMVQDVYTQNHKRLGDYYRALDADHLPIERGVTLSRDDLIRRTVIMELMCQFQLSPAALEEKYHLSFDSDFDDYFARERQDLKALEADGLVEVSPHLIQVTPAGRLLIRNIAAVFDAYLKHQQVERFSKAV